MEYLKGVKQDEKGRMIALVSSTYQGVKEFTMLADYYAKCAGAVKEFKEDKMSAEEFCKLPFLGALDNLVRNVRPNAKGKYNNLQEFAAYVHRCQFDFRAVEYNSTSNSYVINANIGEDVIATMCKMARSFILLGQMTSQEDKLIRQKAVHYGVAETAQDFEVNIDKHYIFFKTFGIFAQFKETGEYTIVANKEDKTKKINIRDKNFNQELTTNMAKMTGIDYDTENTILNINGNSLTLKTLLSELSELSSSEFRLENIFYIGFTPSNSMFKVKAGHVMYSVQFGDFAKFTAESRKNISVSHYMLSRYFSKYRNDSTKPFYIVKCSEKDGRDYAYSCLDGLHSKYSTMRDIYVSDRFR